MYTREYTPMYACLHMHMCVHTCAKTGGVGKVSKAEIQCWQPYQSLGQKFCCFSPSIFQFIGGLLDSKHSYKFLNLTAWRVNS